MSEDGFMIGVVVFALVMAVASLSFIKYFFELQSRRASIILFAVALLVFGGIGYVAVTAVFDADDAMSAFHQQQGKELENTAAPR